MKDKMIWMFFKYLGLVLLLWLSASTGYANRSATVKKYGVEDGLPSDVITCIFQDKLGFIWIGTNDGISRFDGHVFRNNRNNPLDSFTISGNIISAIVEPQKGLVFAGTLDHGLNLWGAETDRFLKITNSVLSRTDTVCALFALPQGNILVGTASKISIMARDSSKLNTVFVPPNDGDVSGIRSTVVCDVSSQGFLLIGLGKSIVRYNISSNLFEILQSSMPPIGNITSILSYKKDNYLIGSSQGLLLARVSGNVLSVIKNVSSTPVLSLLKGSDGTLWVGTQLGIHYLDYEGNLMPLTFFNPKVGDEELQGVTSLMEDSNSLIWVGTSNHGLFKLDLIPPKFFSRINRFRKSGSSIIPELVSALSKKDGDKLLIGTEIGEVFESDGDLLDIRLFPILNSDLFAKNSILSLLQCLDGEVLVGTSVGLFVVDSLTQKAHAVNDSRNDGNPAFSVNSMVVGHKGEVWVATSRGLAKYLAGSLNFFDANSLNVTSLEVDDLNNLWIGTLDGLFLVESSSQKMKKMEGVNALEKKLFSFPILSMASDRLGRLWLGTKSGLILFNKVNFSISLFALEGKILTNDLICSIICDDLDQVWVSTQRGVYQIRKSGEVFSFGIDDGMEVVNVAYRATSTLPSGKIYFGGTNGVAYANSPRVAVVNSSQKLAISSIKWFSKGEVAKEYVGNTNSLTIRGSDELRIEFEFANLDFTNPLKNRYKVRLKGINKDWTFLGNNNIATFYDLPAGDYTIEMLASNSDGVFAEKPLLFQLTITPPLFKSGFAIAFYVLALLFLAQLIYSYGFRYLRRTKKSLKNEMNSKRLFEAQSVKLVLTNKNLTDSIDYAKRIQVAMLPTSHEINKILPKSFVYFRPKDVVSGDFYAVFEKLNQIVVVAADCTGHGVPGAFMSMLGYDMLKNIVNVQNIVEPAEILKVMNNEVVSMLRHRGDDNVAGEHDVNDGMDMAVCVIDKMTKSLRFSGAINSLYLIRNNEIKTFKGCRYSVGHRWIEDENLFTSEHIQLEDDDACYLFSDGYIDQFGGVEGKKFKHRRFRHLLLQTHRLPYEAQLVAVESIMKDWLCKGNYSQVDDMLVFGFNPLATSSSISGKVGLL